MAVYSVEGKLGTGKSLFCVWRAQEALWAGRRVAANFDLKPWELVKTKRTHYTRLPDHPSRADLLALGHGNPESYEEDRNGVLLLDELGAWLNSRGFQDKSRAGVLDWFLHARKLGWDVYLIVQSAQMIDKQVREGLIEYEIRCLRMDKVRIPFIGRFLSAFYERAGYWPRFHMATARLGYGADSKIVADRWMFRGGELYAGYDTRQVFRADYEHGAHSVLPPWAWVPAQSLLQRWRERVARLSPFRRPTARVLRPKLPEVQRIMALPLDQRIEAWRALFGDQWVRRSAAAVHSHDGAGWL